MAGRDDRPKRENAIQRFFRETTGELKKVTWPTREEARNMTVIVLVVMVFVSVFLWLIDLGAEFLIKKAIGG